ESASAAAVPEILKKAINAGKDIMVMSVGGLVADEDLIGLAKKSGSTLYIPSGAICGLDGVKAAAMKGIEEAILTTRKPPKGLKDAPYINKKAIDLDSLKSDKVIFDGTAQEAVREFPKNINVSAVLSLAGIGAKKTRVRIICSPGQKSNIHEIEVKGEFGKLTARTENVPSPNNPKTSFLAALSAIATLKGIVENIKIGT
ncbi:MAG: DUF108 domain-containing protein, partial [Candidatus Omnitrophica bacterium]|nr:DUF108 domain-containing protein [Candidatus Omnitrophota bacterium]